MSKQKLTFEVDVPDDYTLLSARSGDITTHVFDDKSGIAINCMIGIMPVMNIPNQRAALIAQCEQDKIDYPEFWWELWQVKGKSWVTGQVPFDFYKVFEYRQHPHRASIIAWHACSDEDKKRWQQKNKDYGDWFQSFPSWDESYEYRLRPRTCQVTINGKVLEYPEPVREMLNIGQEYWVSDVINGQVHKHFWRNDSIDNKSLKAGLIQLTEQSAKQHLSVLQAVNAQVAL